MTNLPWSRQLGNVQVDGGEAGLLSSWNMWVESGIVPDQTGSNDGTIVGNLHGQYDALGRNLNFNSSAEINVGDTALSIASGSITFSFWVRFHSVAAFQALISKGSTANNQNYYVRINAGQLQFYFRNAANTANIVFTTTDTPIVVGRLYHIVLAHTFGSGSLTKFYVNGVDRPGAWTGGTGDELPLTNAFSAYLGSRAANSQLYGDMHSVKFFTVYQDQSWVDGEFARGKSSLWSTKYGINISAAAVTGGPLENSPFRVESGSHQISSYSINGVSAKVLECVTAGDVSLVAGHYHNDPIDSAFGEYDCRIEKAAGHTTKLGFICQDRNTTANGYGPQILTDGTTTIEEFGVGSVVTGGSLTPGTLARVQMKRRTFDNRFEGLIDGVSFGTGADSTITQSYYTVFSLGAGDKIILADSLGGHAFLKKAMA